MILWKKNTHIWRLNNINCFIILFNTRALVRVEEQRVEGNYDIFVYCDSYKTYLHIKGAEKNANIMEKQER